MLVVDILCYELAYMFYLECFDSPMWALGA